LRLTGNFMAWSGKADEAERVWASALEYAERADSPTQVAEILNWNAWSLWWGSLPAGEGIQRADEIIERAAGNPYLEAIGMVMRGCLKGMRGDFSGARVDIVPARARLFDMKRMANWAGTAMVAADVELLARNPAAAAEALAGAYEWMSGQSETGYIATVAGLRAAAALDLGREDDALAFADETARIAQADDVEALVRQACVRARVLARRRDHDAAAEALQAAVALAEPTDFLTLREYVAMSRAEVAGLAGNRDEQRAALEEALRLAELKGDVVTAQRAREGLAEN
jgi:tetratricopeptide (TPR) repeat protein